GATEDNAWKDTRVFGVLMLANEPTYDALPVANAGNDDVVDENTLVTLDGTSSSDAEAGTLSYLWFPPEGITLSDATIAQPTFDAPEVTETTDFSFGLIINDGVHDSPIDYVIVTVNDISPVADAGPDQVADDGVIVTLDGSGSYDPKGASINYNWTSPAGITLSDPTIAKPTFIMPNPAASNEYVFGLQVDNGSIFSEYDYITVRPTSATGLILPIEKDTSYAFVGNMITLDGYESEAEWSDINIITTPFQSPIGFRGADDLSAYFRTCFNDRAFYVFANISDDTAAYYDGENGGWWDFDAFEVMFNLDTVGIYPDGSYLDDAILIGFNRGYANVSTIIVGSKVDGYDDPELKFAQIENGTGWQIEIEIPWNYILPSGLEPEDIVNYVNTFIGFDIKIDDADTDDPYYPGRDAQLTWDTDGLDGTEDNAWNDTRVFGLMKLIATQTAPNANAGEDFSAYEKETVQLDGSKSFDYQGDEITFSWSSLEGITLFNSNTPYPSFTLPDITASPEQYMFELTVYDGLEYSLPDTITVTSLLELPAANAGEDQIKDDGVLVTLDGSGSSDPDGLPLNYYWIAPDWISLSDNTAEQPTFTMPNPAFASEYIFQLQVDNGTSYSEIDEVSIIPSEALTGLYLPYATTTAEAFAGDSIVLDGVNDEKFWGADIDVDSMFYSNGTHTGDADLKATINVCFNEKAFYIFAGISDDIAINYDPLTSVYPSSYFDNIEVYFNIDTAGIYYSGAYAEDGIYFRFNRGLDGDDGQPSTTKAEGFNDPALDYVQIDNNGSWVVEAEIPWKYILPSGSDATDYINYINAYTGFDVIITDSDYLISSGYARQDARIAWDADGISGQESNATTNVGALGIMQLTSSITKPIANAGNDFIAYEFEDVTLDGTGSFDYQGDAITYEWTSIDGMTLDDNTLSTPSFTIPDLSSNQDYRFSLIVYDGTEYSVSDTVIVHAQVSPPLAYAGTQQIASEGELLTLDGSGSSDPNGLSLTYSWSAPDGIILSDETAVNPTFTAPDTAFVTEYIFSLVVFNGYSYSSPSYVSILTEAGLTNLTLAVYKDSAFGFTGKQIIIDGIANEAGWGELIPITALYNQPYDFYGDMDLSGEFRVAFNEESFFFYGEILDDEAHVWNADGNDTYMYDNLELYFNIDTNGVFETSEYLEDGAQIRFNRGVSLEMMPDPVWDGSSPFKSAGYNNPLINYIVTEQSSGWSVEAELPWKYILPAGALTEDILDYINKSIGFDVTIADSDGSDPDFGERDAQIAWDSDGLDGYEDNAWQNTRTFGVVYLDASDMEPVADAGSDIDVNENEPVTLDGSGSYDVNNKSITYLWNSIDGVTLSSTNSVAPSFTAPIITSDAVYRFGLTVNNGTDDSFADTVEVFVSNTPPVAVAGNDNVVDELESGTLDGSSSSDLGDDIVSYLWYCATDLSFGTPTDATTSFTAPEVIVDEIYEVILTVSNSDGLFDRDTLEITVHDANKPPVGNAGSDFSEDEGVFVTLDGSGSSDSDGDALTYSWTSIDGATISGANSVAPTFTVSTVTSDTEYRFSLIVNDGLTNSEADTVIVTITNTKPVANAGTDININEQETGNLNASGSTDNGNDIVSYLWTSELPIDFADDDAVTTSFTAPATQVDMSFEIYVQVTNGSGLSDTDTLIVNVTNNNQDPIASAGTDIEQDENTLVTLDGSGSSDPQTDPITYSWSAPVGVTLSSNNAQSPSFTTPVVLSDTDLEFILVVSDGTYISVADTVVVTVKNTIPVAVAGDDVTLTEKLSGSLNAGSSSDLGDDIQSYEWIADAALGLIDPDNVTCSFTAPAVDADTSYMVILVVTNSDGLSGRDTLYINVENYIPAPIADAGDDASYNEGETVILDGTGSSDPEDRALTYIWFSVDNIELNDSTLSQPSFDLPYANSDTSYSFVLIVNNGSLDSEKDTVVISAVNLAPAANAGADFSVAELSIVNLDGSLSSDNNDDITTYLWTVPAGITLAAANASNTSFTAPEVESDTEYKIVLQVSNSGGLSDKDTITVTVTNVNKAPVADAGSDIEAASETTVSLDGSGSSDSEGSSLTYSWTSLDGIILSGAATVNPQFIVPVVTEDTEFRFVLVVNDGETDSKPDTVIVFVDFEETNISSLTASELVKISPNPAQSFVFIDLSLIESGSEYHTIKMYDVNGKFLSATKTDMELIKVTLDNRVRSGLQIIKIFNDQDELISINKLIIE
ncbi:MAG: hypothetical protein JXA77_03770, partial [Bacteroidales bacterium]|nr:hypothetical protein [Bacteroidales bacterium]